MLGDRRDAAITRTEVREWSERLAGEKPVVANRAFAVMRRSYEWVLGRDLVQSSPNVLTIRQLFDQALWGPRMGAMLLAAFGGLALLLAAIDVYGVVSYSVAERTARRCSLRRT